MRHALWLIKDTTKEGSSCFLADKSYFKNPLVTQCTIIITSCLSIQYPGFDFFVFLAFSSEVSFKIPHEKGKVEERFLKWKKVVLKAIFMPLLKRHKVLPLAITSALCQDTFWSLQSIMWHGYVCFQYTVIRLPQRKISFDMSEIEGYKRPWKSSY